jgi:hypothetical protein
MNKGWRGESYRHYLAAKGIRTKYEVAKIPSASEAKFIASAIASEPLVSSKYAALGRPKILVDPELSSNLSGVVKSGNIILAPTFIEPENKLLKSENELARTIYHELQHVEQDKLGQSAVNMIPAINDAYPDLYRETQLSYLKFKELRAKGYSPDQIVQMAKKEDSRIFPKGSHFALRPDEWSAYDSSQELPLRFKTGEIGSPELQQSVGVASSKMIENAYPDNPDLQSQASELYLNYGAGVDFARENP